MKYNKAAVVELIEKRIAKIRSFEEERLKKARQQYDTQVEYRETDLAKAQITLDAVQKVLNTAYTSHEEFLLAFCKAIQRNPRLMPDPVVESDIFARSQSIQDVLEVFKSGAPEEVSTTDLRTFGLTDFVKAGK